MSATSPNGHSTPWEERRGRGRGGGGKGEEIGKWEGGGQGVIGGVLERFYCPYGEGATDGRRKMGDER